MKKITEDLFTFPIVMVDGENEEQKEKEQERFGNISSTEKEPVEYDIVYGEASYPYYYFMGFEDRWLPTQKSLQRALRKKFDACIVRFENVGQFLVPLSKEKFKETIEEFSSQREEIIEKDEKQNVKVMEITHEMLANLINKKDE